MFRHIDNHALRIGAFVTLGASAAACHHAQTPGTESPRAHAEPEETRASLASSEEGTRIDDTNDSMRASDAVSEGIALQAEAELEAAEGESVEGTVALQTTTEGVRLIVGVKDAPPGKHGFHIHEKGDCTAIRDKSMGGHLNPASNEHALPSESQARHLGDLGNLEVGADGKGYLELTVADANLEKESDTTLLGKSIVLHRGADSGKAHQPSGDSGTPIACGVIEAED